MDDELTLVRAAARVIEERKGGRLVLVDMRESSVPTGYFLIAEGEGAVQVRAIARALIDELPVAPGRQEGVSEGRWALLDFGDFIVHLFDREVRGFYDLEGLWPDYVVSDGLPGEG